MGYCTTYRELLAVVTFVKQFRHYLYGRPFLLRTDHSSLVWLKNFKEPEGLLARWISLLETYDFNIQHRRGHLHGNADALSRKPRKRCKREGCKHCSPEMGLVSALVSPMADNQSEHNKAIEPESNWLEQWSLQYLQDQQDQDVAITKIKRLLSQQNGRPKLNDPLPNVNTLLRQWNRLKLENNILYRVWEGNEGESRLQLVAQNL